MRGIFSLGLWLALALAPSVEAASFLAPSSFAAPCADIKAEGRSYSVCRFDPKRDDLRLFWRAPNGEPLGSFEAAATTLAPGEKLVFAMNAGMYDDHQAPIGLYIEKGVELKRANTRGGAGNFHLKPNGVFFIGGGRAGVMETSHFLSQRPKVDYATQSGPMLVVNGRIHPRIHSDGVSEKVRNGVGVDREGHVVFAISNQPVTFHQFATLFKDALGCDNALFLDGSISALYAPNLGRNDFTLPMGPMIGAVAKGR
ncbi:MAG TPA: phosphodiester glycosidase family protein [Rhodoblastus sp.]|nr:phosphodiester glycosidase family protein [Rhodoblastus sp.]